VLLVFGWFLSGGNAPDYTAADQDWTTWADDNQWKSRIGGRTYAPGELVTSALGVRASVSTSAIPAD
jgi:hypothetical protein